MSFPDLGAAPYTGSTPVILYGPDCASPLPPPKPPPSPPTVGLGDAARVEPATPADPSDPLLREWVKTQPGPVVFDGVPCSFPGRVWKSQVGAYWNMLCAYDGSGKGPWARYSSTDPALMTWKLADLDFTNVHGGAAAGALFHALPGAPTAAEGGPTHMISASGGAAVYLGTYDPTTEKLNVTSKVAQGTGGDGAWAAVGTNGPDPTSDGGRVLTTSWINGGQNGIGAGSALSLVRDLRYERSTGILLARPTPELDLLHNLTVLDGQPLGTVAATNGTKPLPYPGAVGGTSDTTVTIAVPTANKTGQSFGIAVRTAPGTLAHAGGVVHIMVSPVDPKTGQRRTSFGFGAFAEDGARSPWDEVTGSRRPEVALSGFGTFPVLPGEDLTIRVLVDRNIAEAFVQGGKSRPRLTSLFPCRARAHSHTANTRTAAAATAVCRGGLRANNADSGRWGLGPGSIARHRMRRFQAGLDSSRRTAGTPMRTPP